MKGVQFDSWRRVGAEMQTVQGCTTCARSTNSSCSTSPPAAINAVLISSSSTNSRTSASPRSRWGVGCASIEDVRDLLMARCRQGCGRARLPSSRPALVRDIADRFGSQCIVVSIERGARPPGGTSRTRMPGPRSTGRDAVDLAREAEAAGAGEILLTSIDRDGTMEGYDLELTRSVCDAVSDPRHRLGWVRQPRGTWWTRSDAGAAAVAAASVFHFTELTPLAAKEHLAGRGLSRTSLTPDRGGS